MKRGTRKRNILSVMWTSELAYAIGLIATDGNLSPDGRHIGFTSKDKELVEYIRTALSIKNKIGMKARGGELSSKKYYVIQFGSVQFFEFLQSIGLTQAKSKTMSKILVPNAFYSDFLRGCYDGDGNFSECTHPESKSLQLRSRLYSASRLFLEEILKECRQYTPIKGGWISATPLKSVYALSFGKRDSILLFKVLYGNDPQFFLRRKYAIAKKYL
jgi:hypothetical protein